ncbi:MAG: FecR family protein [Patescibacteria group bacterium]|nr:FecR family protein [Patescibacteria group bacterium]
MSAIYYYKRKASPVKWLIAAGVIVAAGFFLYWFYTNYFSKIEIGKPAAENNQVASSKNILMSLSGIYGGVQMSVENKDYATAVVDTIIHRGDKIKTAADGRAILNFENGSIIRLAENTEIIFQDTDETNFIVKQTQGRVYYNLSVGANYKVMAQNAIVTALGTKFEVINETASKSVTVLAIDKKVEVEARDADNNLIVGMRLDPNEKASLNLSAAKKDILKIDNFASAGLQQSDPWYKWNFDLDKGLNPAVQTAPKFETVIDSLLLTLTNKENGIYLAWSVYNRDDFKNYQIVRSETNASPKFPADGSIKSFDGKETNSYLDASPEQGKKYYYRICVVKLDGNVACGNVIGAQFGQAEEVKDTTPPRAPVLSATISESGVNLNWTKNSDSDFKEYAILRSAYNMSPAYSADKLTTRKIKEENYLDKEVNITSVGAYYYKVCSVDNSDNFSCSNAVSVIDGKIQ